MIDRFVTLGAVMGCLSACGGSTSTPTTPSNPNSGVAACSAIGSTNAIRTEIVRGTSCSPATTSVVLVNIRDTNGQPVGFCSGTVIATRAVLTAAHCLNGDAAQVRVYPGTGSEIVATSFQSTLFDVGVVITSADIPRTPMRVLLSRDARVGEQAVIAGWGVDENGNGTVLRAGATTIATVDSSSLTTQSGTSVSSTCSGDSGGPILVQESGVWAVAGVTSATQIGGSCALGTSFFSNVRNSTVSSFILAQVPNVGRQ